MSGLKISEIFGPTVQGEGPLIGRPTVFVRTGGCDYRCSWCDTLYAVLPAYRGQWRTMSAAEVLAEVDALAGGVPVLVTLSGGNPAIQPLGPLLEEGHARGHRFAMETQGSVARDWFAALDWLVLSPKPPSSEMETDWAVLGDCLTAAGEGSEVALKVVVFDEADYRYAREVAARFPAVPLYLQVGNHTPPAPSGQAEPVDDEGLRARFRWLAERIAADRWYEVRLLPQLHVWAWGNSRGV